MNNQVFFSKNGITMTHAANIKNVCKEVVENDNIKLKNINFVNHFVNLIGSSDKTQTKVGCNSSHFITESISVVSNANALNAWLGEAIKAKETMLKEVESISVRAFVENVKGEVLPIGPGFPNLYTENEAILEMSISDRFRYLSLEAKASVIGKAIHPDGGFAEARKKALSASENPVRMSGSGRDTTVTTSELSVTLDEIENLQIKLQAEHRAAQSELNQIKAVLKKKVDQVNLERNQAYQKKSLEYGQAMNLIQAELSQHVLEKKMEVSKLKIRIPEELKEFYDKLDAMMTVRD